MTDKVTWNELSINKHEAMGNTTFGWEAPSLGGAACEEPGGVRPWSHQAEVRDDTIFFFKALISLLLWLPKGGPKFMEWSVKTSKKNKQDKTFSPLCSCGKYLLNAYYALGLADSNIYRVRNQKRSLLSYQSVTEVTGIISKVL